MVILFFIKNELEIVYLKICLVLFWVDINWFLVINFFKILLLFLFKSLKSLLENINIMLFF